MIIYDSILTILDFDLFDVKTKICVNQKEKTLQKSSWYVLRRHKTRLMFHTKIA